jgi:hypothetical protein
MEVEKALVQWKAELLQANEVIAYWEASLANRWICGMYLGWKPTGKCKLAWEVCQKKVQDQLLEAV